jgi:hypothetical protein
MSERTLRPEGGEKFVFQIVSPAYGDISQQTNISTLKPEKWLNDEDINFEMKLSHWHYFPVHLNCDLSVAVGSCISCADSTLFWSDLPSFQIYLLKKGFKLKNQKNLIKITRIPVLSYSTLLQESFLPPHPV